VNKSQLETSHLTLPDIPGVVMGSHKTTSLDPWLFVAFISTEYDFSADIPSVNLYEI
jgi:hypothetical protein